MLKITRLNNPPLSVAGKYESSTIYLVRTESGFVRMMFTGPDGTLVGESIQVENIVGFADVLPAPTSKSPLFILNTTEGSLYAKHYSEGTWGWINVSGNKNPGLTLSDLLVTSATAPELPSQKVFWFNPNQGGGLHVQVDENGTTVWKQTDFLDESVLQQKVDQASAAANAAASSAFAASTEAGSARTKALEVSAIKTQIEDLSATIHQEALGVAGNVDLATAAKNQAVSAATAALQSEVEAFNSKADAIAAKDQTQQLKNDVQALINGIQNPDTSGLMKKSLNLGDVENVEESRLNLGLGALSVKDNITSQDVVNALGYVPADEAILIGINQVLESILGPAVVTPPADNGGGIPA